MEHLDFGMFMIYDHIQGFNTHIHITCLWWSTFLIGRWFAELCARQNGDLDPGEPTLVGFLNVEGYHHGQSS